MFVVVSVIDTSPAGEKCVVAFLAHQFAFKHDGQCARRQTISYNAFEWVTYRQKNFGIALHPLGGTLSPGWGLFGYSVRL